MITKLQSCYKKTNFHSEYMQILKDFVHVRQSVRNVKSRACHEFIVHMIDLLHAINRGKGGKSVARGKYLARD